MPTNIFLMAPPLRGTVRQESSLLRVELRGELTHQPLRQLDQRP